MATHAWPRVTGHTRPAAWSLFLAANLALGVLYFVLPTFGVTDAVVTILFLAVAVASPVAMVYGVRRHRPAGRRGWMLLAAGQMVIAAAEFGAAGAEYFGGGFHEPALSDVLYLGAYPVTFAALLIFVRRRTPHWDAASALDAAIVGVGAALLSWVFVVQPLASDAGAGTAAKVVQIGYPVLDLLLLVVTVRLVLGVGVRTASFAMLVASIVALLLADTGYSVLSLLERDQFVSPMDGLWMASYALMGAAALHPSMRRVDERSAAAAPDATLGRLVALTLAVMTAPAVQVAQHLRGADVFVPLMAGCCAVMFLLVMVRMAGMVAAQRTAAITDGLTGLKTRRYFEQCLATEVQRALRGGQPIGLLIIDVDHFKRINDTFGHPGGDRVLTEIARRVSVVSGSGAVVARYGGEEFVVLLPQADPARLTEAAELIRRAVADTPVAVREGALLKVTASLGGSCFPQYADSAGTLVLSADNALYAAKNAGRNCAVLSGGPAGEPLPAG